MFCRHDWHNHRSSERSLRSQVCLDLDPDNPGPCLTVIGIGILNAVAAAVWGLPLALSILVGILVGVSTGFWIYKNVGKDPWAISDRTCLKCGRVQFNLTKTEERLGAIHAKKVEADALRREKVKQAEVDFAKFCRMRQRAQA